MPKISKGGASPIQVHEALTAGLPRRALLKAIPEGIPMPELLAVFGISLRTFMRLKGDPSKRLDPGQSARVWRFAELLTRAEEVLGTPERAVEWLLEMAVHKGFRTLNAVPHVLSFAVLHVPWTEVRVVRPADVPKRLWLYPCALSAAQQAFGNDLLRAHEFVALPSAVSRRSWNLIFDAERAAGKYELREQEALEWIRGSIRCGGESGGAQDLKVLGYVGEARPAAEVIHPGRAKALRYGGMRRRVGEWIPNRAEALATPPRLRYDAWSDSKGGRMYVIREILNCKPGKVRPMVEKFKVISTVLKEMGHEPMRLLTDVAGGPFWTLVGEVKVNGLDEFFAIEQKLMANETLRKTMADYHDLVVSGRREIYRIEG